MKLRPATERLSCLLRPTARCVLTLLPKLRRCFWLLMVIGHGPALISAWRASASSGSGIEPLVGCLVLALSMLFFALKLGDVACLRFRTDRRSVVAFCVVVALLHLDVIRPAEGPTLIPEYTALVATTCLVGALPSRFRQQRQALMHAASACRKCRPPAPPTADTLWLDLFRPHCWTLAYRFFHLRAPPA